MKYLTSDKKWEQYKPKILYPYEFYIHYRHTNKQNIEKILLELFGENNLLWRIRAGNVDKSLMTGIPKNYNEDVWESRASFTRVWIVRFSNEDQATIFRLSWHN